MYVNLGADMANRVTESGNKLTIDMGGASYKSIRVHSCCLDAGDKLNIPVMRFPQISTNGSALDYRGVIGASLNGITIIDGNDWRYNTVDYSPLYFVPSPIQRLDILFEEADGTVIAIAAIDYMVLILEIE